MIQGWHLCRSRLSQMAHLVRTADLIRLCVRRESWEVCAGGRGDIICSRVAHGQSLVNVNYHLEAASQQLNSPATRAKQPCWLLADRRVWFP